MFIFTAMASKMEHLAKDEWEKVMAAESGGFAFDFDFNDEEKENESAPADTSDSEAENIVEEHPDTIETVTDMGDILQAARCTIAETFCKNPDNKLATKEWDDKRKQFRVSTNKWLGIQQVRQSDAKHKEKRKR